MKIRLNECLVAKYNFPERMEAEAFFKAIVPVINLSNKIIRPSKPYQATGGYKGRQHKLVYGFSELMLVEQWPSWGSVKRQQWAYDMVGKGLATSEDAAFKKAYYIMRKHGKNPALKPQEVTKHEDTQPVAKDINDERAIEWGELTDNKAFTKFIENSTTKERNLIQDRLGVTAKQMYNRYYRLKQSRSTANRRK